MDSRELTVHERMEIEMAYAVPLLRDLQEILGADVVADALRSRLTLQTERAKERARPATSMREQAVRIGRDFERFAAGDALTYTLAEPGDSPGETSSDDDQPSHDEVAVDVSECRYATMMDNLDATDLGSLLICGPDHAAAAAGGMELLRSQTRMEGADHCDFRFRSAEPEIG